MTPDFFDDDENVKAMRATAQQIGVTALLRDLRQEQVKAMELLDANRARITKVLVLLGASDKELS